MSNITEATDDDFSSEVLEAEGLVFVDFWMEDCGACEAVAPLLKKLAKEFDGQVKFVKVFKDDAPDTIEEYSVESYPRLVLFKDGEEVEDCGDDESVPDLEQIRDFLTGHVGESDEEEEEEEDEEEEASDEEEEEEEDEEEEASDEDEEEEEEEKEAEGPGLLEVAGSLLGAFLGGDDDGKKKKRDRDDEE